jgi:probable rRNA maturation factor
MTTKPHPLDISIDAAGWRKIPGLRTRLELATDATFAALPKNLRFPCAAALLLTTDAAVRRLNRDFRGMDKPTNVLSFPQWEAAQLTKKGKARGLVTLGDIVIAYQYVVLEARKDHKILINHTTHLLIHGLLHLFGYNHELDAEAYRMERLEKKIMAGLGLPDPYDDIAETVKRSPATFKNRR